MRPLRGIVGIVASMAMVGVTSVSAQAARTDAGAARAPGGSVIVEDVTIRLPGDAPVHAYVVRPGGRQPDHAAAGILFLHWFAPGTTGADRAEFLSEAVALAEAGTVSLLPQQTFPWDANPVGDARDIATIKAEIAVDRNLIGWLAGDHQVDPARIGIVGHDYGAMYGAVLADTDGRVRTAVAITPDATWGNWFVKYWLGYTGDRAADYQALFASLDPIGHVNRLGSHLFLQFADHDIFIDAATRQAFMAAAPHAAVVVYPADHSVMVQTAKDQRDSWLAWQLRLGHA
jgi:dienelactone hydrolase